MCLPIFAGLQGLLLAAFVTVSEAKDLLFSL
jgi:hypothetical protein